MNVPKGDFTLPEVPAQRGQPDDPRQSDRHAERRNTRVQNFTNRDNSAEPQIFQDRTTKHRHLPALRTNETARNVQSELLAVDNDGKFSSLFFAVKIN